MQWCVFAQMPAVEWIRSTQTHTGEHHCSSIFMAFPVPKCFMTAFLSRYIESSDVWVLNIADGEEVPIDFEDVAGTAHRPPIVE